MPASPGREQCVEIQGGCLCGSVRYSVTGPFLAAANCHCSHCRKAHGAAFGSFAPVKRADFRWLSGEPLLSRYESSPGNYRHFCGKCGSQVVVEVPWRPDGITIALGSVDGDPGVRPAAHIFASAKAPWYEITDDLFQSDGWPPGVGPPSRRAAVPASTSSLGSHSIDVRVAALSEVAIVSEILTEAAVWLLDRGIPLWDVHELTPARLSPEVQAGRYVLAWSGSTAVGTIRLCDSDPLFWPGFPPGEALYLHRLAVRRTAAGGSVSSALLGWAKAHAEARGVCYLRLDCEVSRSGLRRVYERFGFRFHSEARVGPSTLARYELAVPSTGRCEV